MLCYWLSFWSLRRWSSNLPIELVSISPYSYYNAKVIFACVSSMMMFVVHIVKRCCHMFERPFVSAVIWLQSSHVAWSSLRLKLFKLYKKVIICLCCIHRLLCYPRIGGGKTNNAVLGFWKWLYVKLRHLSLVKIITTLVCLNECDQQIW